MLFRSYLCVCVYLERLTLEKMIVCICVCVRVCVCIQSLEEGLTPEEECVCVVFDT